MGKWNEFIQGYGLGQKMVNDYESQKTKDMVKAANEEGMKQTTQTTSNYGKVDANAVYTGEGADGAMTNAEAASYGINVPVEDKAAGTGVIRQYGLGANPQKFQDAEFTPEQQRMGGLKAQAGVYAARGDTDMSNKILSQIQQGVLAEKQITQADLQIEQAKRMGLREDKADAVTATLEGVDKEAGDWMKSRLKNPDGTERVATVDDHLAATQFRANKLMEAGRANEAGALMKDFNAQALVKIQLETAQRAEALKKTSAALAAGDLNAVKDFYNQFTPDGAKVVSVTRDGAGRINIERTTDDGRKMPPHTLKDTGELSAALNLFSDPMALYNWSQNEFRNNLALKADARAGQSLGIQGGQLALAQQAGAREAKKFGIQQPSLQAEADRLAGSETARKALEKAEISGDPVAIEMATKVAYATGALKRPGNEYTASTDQFGTNVTRINKATGQVDIVDPKTGAVKTIPSPHANGAPAAASQSAKPSSAAVSFLKANPSTAAAFDQKYGPGASKKAMADW